MRNYPLFTNDEKELTVLNWQQTFVNSLSMNIKSLIDYSNYFLADYREGPEFLLLGQMRDAYNSDLVYNCYSIEKLKFHQYKDTTEDEGIYFLKQSDYDDLIRLNNIPIYSGDTSDYRKIRSGCHIVNNNKPEAGIIDTKIWDNIAIQPIGFNAYYLLSLNKNILTFSYTKNAQLFYGSVMNFSILDFYTRFFFKGGSYQPDQNTFLDVKSIELFAESGGELRILDKQNFEWTDTIDNPVMGFMHTSSDKDVLGEEIITDSRIEWKIRVDKTSIATYNITSLEPLQSNYNYWPVGFQIYFL